MRSWLINAVAVGVAAIIGGSSMSGLQNNNSDDSKWIEPLKSASLSQIDPGLPDKPFATWLNEHTRGAEVKYFLEACDGSANVESLPKGTYSCVTVTAVRGAASESVMRFLVVAAGEKTAQANYSCKFVIGQDGPPPGSMVKRPTRVFRKLSEMTERLDAR